MRSIDRILLFSAVLVCLCDPAPAAPATRPARPPNIILILSDDVGYGDVGCYGATKVKTPNIDRLAAQGLRFTDGHCTAATCTPSRYSLLTGEYAWRRKGTGILAGDAPLIIDPARPTLPRFLRDAGYVTGCVGKWHLGLGTAAHKVDWNGDIAPGPLEIGFDESFIIPATGDRVPCVFVEGHRVVGFDPADPIAVSYGLRVGNEPTGREHPELLTMKPSHGHDDTIVNGISRIGFMAGGTAARWKDDQIADTLAQRAIAFIEQHGQKSGDSAPAKPFFLYFAPHDIHVPRVPSARFRGTSQCGVRGDAIQELDGTVGQIMESLERLKLADNTLLIFSSDNGPVVDDGYADGSVVNLNGHTPAGPLRGGKYSLYEGGTRVPFIVRWPNHVVPAQTSDALVCQIDFIPTFAALIGAPAPAAVGSDAINILPALLGESKAGRDALVEQGGGYPTALRQGRWRFIPRPNAGPKAPKGELYDLEADLGETKNLASENADRVQAMGAALEKIRQSGPLPAPGERTAR